MILDKSLMTELKRPAPKVPVIPPATSKDVNNLAGMFSELTNAIKSQQVMINNKLNDIEDEVTAKAKYQFIIKRNADKLIESITVVEK
jgi:uncharacterized protein YfcZ (UPF0381/DUF406 family)